jgi:CreA protein
LPCYSAHIGDGVALEVVEMKRSKLLALTLTVFMLSFGDAPASAQSGPDLIFRKSVDFKLLTPNDKLATYAIDDPIIDGVACYYTAHEKGGVAGMFGVAEQSSEVSLACRQYGPISFKEKFGQGDTAFSERRSLLFKRMHIVRGCDAKRNVLVYMVYSDKLVEGSPESSTSTVAIQPWTGQNAVPKCGEFLNR